VWRVFLLHQQARRTTRRTDNPIIEIKDMTELETIYADNARRNLVAQLAAFEDAIERLKQAEVDLLALDAGTFEFEPTFFFPEFDEVKIREGLTATIKNIRSAYPSVFS
tara:strand:+ start:156 stop:482 length:327 start_codon:yes stop_codon:yes gene_type:complete